MQQGLYLQKKCFKSFDIVFDTYFFIFFRYFFENIIYLKKMKNYMVLIFRM